MASLVTALEELSASRVAPLELLEKLLVAALEATGAQRGFVVRYQRASDQVAVLCRREFATSDLNLSEHELSRSVLRKALRGVDALVLSDALEDPDFAEQPSVLGLALRSVLAVPFPGVSGPTGALYLENNQRASAFGGEEQLAARVAASAMAMVVSLAGLAEGRDAGSVTSLEARIAPEIVTRDPRMLEILELVKRAAAGPAPVLVVGESGTGKELVAQAIHRLSRRRERPFVAVNSAAIPKELVESQLFGHEKGAFTGATSRFRGLIAAADGGTLFLDEIGELEPATQGKLLRFLQTKEVQRLGTDQVQRIDVRIVAATSRDLEAAVQDGSFQSALYYRLNVVRLELPPLRHRPGDVELLLRHFLRLHGPDYGRQLEVDPVAMAWLRRYRFPGNVRELENFAQQFLALVPEDVVHLGDLPREVLNLGSSTAAKGEGVESPGIAGAGAGLLLDLPLRDRDDLERRRRQLERRLEDLERGLAERVLEEHDGNKRRAAEALGIHRSTLYDWLNKDTADTADTADR